MASPRSSMSLWIRGDLSRSIYRDLWIAYSTRVPNRKLIEFPWSYSIVLRSTRYLFILEEFSFKTDKDSLGWIEDNKKILDRYSWYSIYLFFFSWFEDKKKIAKNENTTKTKRGKLSPLNEWVFMIHCNFAKFIDAVILSLIQ